MADAGCLSIVLKLAIDEFLSLARHSKWFRLDPYMSGSGQSCRQDRMSSCRPPGGKSLWKMEAD